MAAAASAQRRADREVVMVSMCVDNPDLPVVLAAVAKNGYALKYAAEELRGDREVVLAAVRPEHPAVFF